jgi:hypothetical protein
MANNNALVALVPANNNALIALPNTNNIVLNTNINNTNNNTNNNNRTLWTNPQLGFLINERRRLNFDFHYSGRSHVTLWSTIAINLNTIFGTSYTGVQCKTRFQNLVSQYHVNKKIYI